MTSLSAFLTGSGLPSWVPSDERLGLPAESAALALSAFDYDWVEPRITVALAVPVGFMAAARAGLNGTPFADNAAAPP